MILNTKPPFIFFLCSKNTFKMLIFFIKTVYYFSILRRTFAMKYFPTTYTEQSKSWRDNKRYLFIYYLLRCWLWRLYIKRKWIFFSWMKYHILLTCKSTASSCNDDKTRDLSLNVIFFTGAGDQQNSTDHHHCKDWSRATGKFINDWFSSKYYISMHTQKLNFFCQV